MSNSLLPYGFQIDGNLSLLPSDFNGDGSIELTGTIFTDKILKYTSIEPGVNLEGSIFDNGRILILSTIPGINLTTGSLIVNGGMSISKDSVLFGKITINNTSNSNNIEDGAFSIKGGVFVNKDLNIGNTGVLIINNTLSSINSNIGSVISLGGISIQNTTDSNSFTSGGGLTILGGASINKKLYSRYIISEYSTISNLFTNNLSSNNIISNDINTNNITSTNLSTNTIISNNSILSNSTIQNLFSENSSISNLYLNNSFVNNQITNNNSTNNLQVDILNSNFINSTIASFYNVTISNLYVTNEFSYNEIITNLSSANISCQNATINNLQLNNSTFSSLLGINILSEYISTSNLQTDIGKFETLLSTNATIRNNITIDNTQNSTPSLIIDNNGITIYSTINATSSTYGGSITTFGGLSVNKNIYIGNDAFISENLYMNNSIITNVTSPNLDLDVANKWYVDNTTINSNITQGQVVVSTTGGNLIGFPSFTFDNIQNSLVLSGTNDATSLTEGGTLSISGGTRINKQLFVGGNTHILGFLDMNNQKISSIDNPNLPYDATNKYYVDDRFDNFTISNLSGNFTQGQIIVASNNGSITGLSSFIFNQNKLSILTTSNSLGLGSGGSLDIQGGVSILKDVFIGGILNLNNKNITNVTSPNNNLDVANKYYVDNQFTNNVLFSNTNNSINSTSGGSLTTLGGVAVGKNLYIGTQLFVQNKNLTPNLGDISHEITFNIQNNISTPTDIIGFSFNNSTVRYFKADVSIFINSPNPKYSGFEIKGIQKNSQWILQTSFIGDNTLSFTINNSGQIQYTSKNFTGFISGLLKFRAITTSI